MTWPTFATRAESSSTLAWGDSVEVLEEGPKRVRIALTGFQVRSDGSQIPVKREGSVARGTRSAPAVVEREKAAVLKVDFVDVQQGDAAVIETPRGEVIFGRRWRQPNEKGDDDAFDFLAGEKISVEVLGPIPTKVKGKAGLKFLGEPSRKLGHSSQSATTFGGLSPSHTINGHSIVLRLAYGDWHLLFAGDLKEQAEGTLADLHEAKELDLRSEVFKVPHHGSADFLHRFLEAVEPVVSVVSSGDEREFIHPRATLMSALGKYGRDQEPVVFVTEMVASFKPEGFVKNNPPKQGTWAKRRDPFFAFSRPAFGLVRVRTDGERLLVYTNSGQAGLRESTPSSSQTARRCPRRSSRSREA